MKKQLILLVIALLPCTAFSQVLFDNIWLFGNNYGTIEQGFGGSIFDFRQNPVKISYFSIPFDLQASAMIRGAVLKTKRLKEKVH